MMEYVLSMVPNSAEKCRVAAAGFEPRDLRFMRPTSYHCSTPQKKRYAAFQSFFGKGFPL